MRLYAFISIIIALLIAVAACTGSPSGPPLPTATKTPPDQATPAPADWQKTWNDTLAAARQEGEVLIYLNAPSEARLALSEAFNKKFGLKMDTVMGAGAQITTKINSEYRAGIHQADAVMSGASGLWSDVKPQGYLTRIEDMMILPEVKDPKAWVGGNLPLFDKDGTVGFYLSVANPPVIRNTDLVKEGQVTSYQDLLKPEWKGKMVIYDPTIQGGGNFGATRLLMQWGPEKADEYFYALLNQQQILVTRDQRQQIDWVARGKYPLALWPQSPAVSEFVQAGTPIAGVTLKENVGVSPSNGGFARPNQPPHPNAIKVFFNWFLSKEGQTLAVSSFGAPSARVDVPVTGFAKVFEQQPSDKVYIQNEQFTVEQQQLLANLQKVFNQGGAR